MARPDPKPKTQDTLTPQFNYFYISILVVIYYCDCSSENKYRVIVELSKLRENMKKRLAGVNSSAQVHTILHKGTASETVSILLLYINEVGADETV